MSVSARDKREITASRPGDVKKNDYEYFNKPYLPEEDYEAT